MVDDNLMNHMDNITKDEYVKCFNDLQLAAKLGKELFEKNNKLDLALKEQQSLIDEKNLEIEYLSNQVKTLREDINSKCEQYDELQYSVQELEKEKQKLLKKNKFEKQINLISKVCLDKFEDKCFDLEQTIEKCEVQSKLDQKTIKELLSNLEELKIENSRISEDNYLLKKQKSLLENFKDSNVSVGPLSENCNDNNIKDEKINGLENVISDLKMKRDRDLWKFEELEDQISTYVQENRMLNAQINELCQKDDNVKNLSDELLSIDNTIQKEYVCNQSIKLNNNDDDNHELDNHTSLTSFEQPSIVSTVNNDSNEKEIAEKCEVTLESCNELLENNSEDISTKIETNEISISTDVLKKATELITSDETLSLRDNEISIVVSEPEVLAVTSASEDTNVNQIVSDQCAQIKLSNKNRKSEIPSNVEGTKSIVKVKKDNKNINKSRSKSKNQKDKRKYVPLDMSTIDINATQIKQEVTEKATKTKQCINWEYPETVGIKDLQKLEISYAEVLKKSLNSKKK